MFVQRFFPLFLCAPLLLVLAIWPAEVEAAGKPTRAAAPVDIAKPVLFADSFRQVIERGAANGAYDTVAVGVIDGKRSGSWYFGHRDGGKTAPADEHSLFEIGALSDIFTTLLLSDAAIGGRLRLADPISRFVAPGFTFADPRVAATSLEALATQHSGFPAVPANIFPATTDDAFGAYSTEDLLVFLGAYRGDTAPSGTPPDYAYSIVNCAVLAHLLDRLYGGDFADVMTRNLFAPLGLQHTSLRDDDGLLAGHRHGEAVPHNHYGSLAGAAGLRTTLPDMLQFLQLNLTPNDSPLRGALLLARQPRARGSAGEETALGWNVRQVDSENATWPLLWRASETAGFSAFIGFRIDQQKAIVLLGNSSENLAELGIAWLKDAAPPVAPQSYAVIADSDIAAYAGLYQLAADTELLVRTDNGVLTVQTPGQMPQRLHAIDNDVFVSDLGNLSVTFMRNVDTISGLVLHVNGGHVSAPRLSTRAPRLPRAGIKLTQKQREELIGDYRVDANTWMRIVAQGDTLSVQLTMSERRVVYAYAADHFADVLGAIELAVTRDSAGHVVALSLLLDGVPRIAVPLHQSAS